MNTKKYVGAVGGDPAKAGKNFKDYLTRREFSGKTIRIYERGIEEFLTWTDEHHYTVENIRYADLLNYIKHTRRQGVSKRQMQQQLLSLRHYFNYLVQVGQLAGNPAQGVYIRGIPRRLPHNLVSYAELEKLYERYPVRTLRDHRDKEILGLLIFQAVTAEELELLTLEHINLPKGKIRIPGTGRTNERVLKLDALQVFGLQAYMNETRPRILQRGNNIETTQLIVGMQGYTCLSGTLHWLMKRLQHPDVKQASQIRASVIAEWTRIHDVRVVQYMSGHKYVSTTEKYQASRPEDMQEQLKQHHPLSERTPSEQ